MLYYIQYVAKSLVSVHHCHTGRLNNVLEHFRSLIAEKALLECALEWEHFLPLPFKHPESTSTLSCVLLKCPIPE